MVEENLKWLALDASKQISRVCTELLVKIKRDNLQLRDTRFENADLDMTDGTLVQQRLIFGNLHVVDIKILVQGESAHPLVPVGKTAQITITVKEPYLQQKQFVALCASLLRQINGYLHRTTRLQTIIKK